MGEGKLDKEEFKVGEENELQQIDVLDLNNLPSRPWKPKRDEWIWARLDGYIWMLVRFYEYLWDTKQYICITQAGGEGYYNEVAPFKGELPPGLEEEDE